MDNRIGKKIDGYVLNIPFAPTPLTDLDCIISFLKDIDESCWIVPPRARHITALDWLTPFTDYGGSSPRVFENSFLQIDDIMVEVARSFHIFKIKFSQLTLRDGVAFLTSDDQVELRLIREYVMCHYSFAAGTKPPPNIVHTTIARNIRHTTNLTIDISPLTQDISSLRLVHETRWPMLEFEMIKQYALQSFLLASAQ